MYNVLISPSYKREFIPFLGEGDILVILTMLSKAGQTNWTWTPVRMIALTRAV